MCHVILGSLSVNRHIAQTMSSDPALRAVLVGELRRQVKGWDSTPSQGSSGEGEEEHGTESRPPPASIVVDAIHLTFTLETLRHVMRGSRRRRSSGRRRTAAAVGVGAGAGIGGGSPGTGDRTMPVEEEGGDGERVSWPFRSLYGQDNYYGGAGGGAGRYDAGAFGEEPVEGSDDDWSLDRKLVADIAELMLSAASVRGSEAVSVRRDTFNRRACLHSTGTRFPVEPVCRIVDERTSLLLCLSAKFFIGIYGVLFFCCFRVFQGCPHRHAQSLGGGGRACVPGKMRMRSCAVSLLTPHTLP